MRHILLDTETTGTNSDEGDRIIEIAAIEMKNLKLTGRTLSTFVNPEGRQIPYDSYRIHKISQEQVEHAPLYGDIHQNLIDFIDDGMLVIHNKAFDLKFLRHAAERIGKTFDYDAIDTTDLSVARWPGMPVNLDAVLRRLEIPTDSAALRRVVEEVNFDRTIEIIERSERHGALVDCIWLAKAYVGLVTAHELDLTLNNRRGAKPWPFGSQSLPVVPIRTEALC